MDYFLEQGRIIESDYGDYYIEHEISEYELILRLFYRMYYPDSFDAEKVQKELLSKLAIKKSIEDIKILWRSYESGRQRSELIQYTVNMYDRLREMKKEV
ncbi:MAG: hypothetical protein HQK96_06110 [Nitrospirae bacterium]|nr:hypothetical protein [Nitrospirota bacterium]